MTSNGFRGLAVLTIRAVCCAGAAEPAEPSSPASGQVMSLPAGGNAWHIAAARDPGESEPRIVYACYNGDVFARRPPGAEPLWQYASEAFPYDLAVGDLDGDGQAETLVASADGTLHVLGPDGRLRWKFTASAPLYQVAIARAGGSVWVLTGGVDRNIYLLDAGGTLRKTLPTERVVRLLRAGDLDGDGNDEVIQISHKGEMQALTLPSLDLHRKDRWGDRKALKLRPFEKQARPDKGLWRPYSFSLDDLDGDGRCELLLGSSFYNQGGIQVLGPSGAPLWQQAEGFASRDEGIASTFLAAGDVDPQQPGKEVIALAATRVFVFNSGGKLLTRGQAPIPFNDLCLVPNPGGPADLFLASSPNGDDRIYRVVLSDGWPTALATLGREGRMGTITANLHTLRRQIMDYQGPAPPNRRYIHIVTGGQPSDLKALRQHARVLEFYRKRFPYENCVFAMRINVVAAEPVPGFARPTERRQARGLRSADIPQFLAQCEAAGWPFVVTVGHDCTPQITLDTVRRILEACPNTCLGFQASENTEFGPPLQRFLNDYWYPLMDLCRAHGKKAFLIEKGAWWALIPATDDGRRLADGTYADVLVPSVEDSNSRCPELNLSGRLGLYLSGAVNTFSARTIPDELCWNRYWEWETAMTGHPFLRRQLVQALLGAGVFDYRIQDLKDERFTPVATESIELLIHMLGKGLLVPPRPEEMANVAPIALRLREPSPELLKEAFNFHENEKFEARGQERDWPFSGLACHWGAAPAQPNYIGSYLLEIDRHALNLAPADPFGFPAIVPASTDPNRLPWARGAWETDGRTFYKEGAAFAGDQARSAVLADFQRAAEQLPFQLQPAPGRPRLDVFMQAQRLGPGAYRLTLIDSGILDPAERRVLLNIRPARADPPAAAVDTLRDSLSGELLEVHENQVEVAVPAGAFRILEVRLRPAG